MRRYFLLLKVSAQMPSKMGAPWVPLPHEVIVLLEDETPVCMKSYILMLDKFYIKEIPKTEGIWVAGRINESRYKIINAVSNSRGYFNGKIWPRWIEIGIAQMKDGGIYLPMLYKKGDAFLQPLRMRTEIDELKAQHAEMEIKANEMQNAMRDMFSALSETRNVITIPTITERPETGLSEAGLRSLRGPTTSLLRSDQKKISLSAINLLVSQFYKSIGRSRISKPVRDKAVASFEKLMKDGFKPGEVEFALDWIPKNATEEVKHFGIVAHMIDQALEAGEKDLEEEAAREEKEAEAREKEANIITEQEERELLNEYKGKLSDEAREELRNEALLELRGTPGIRNDMICDALIEVAENDLIRKAGLP